MLLEGRGVYQQDLQRWSFKRNNHLEACDTYSSKTNRNTFALKGFIILVANPNHKVGGGAKRKLTKDLIRQMLDIRDIAKCVRTPEHYTDVWLLNTSFQNLRR